MSSKLFWDFSRLCLSQNSIAPQLNYSETIPNCVFAEIQLHFVEIILTQWQIVSWPKINCISLNLFRDISKLCLGRISTASHRNYSNTIPNRVLAKNQLHLFEIILRQFQIVSQPKFSCIFSKIFQENSKLCIGRKTVASHWSCSKTIPNCVLVEIPLHLIENILRQFHLVS